ncbi:mitochondrial ribosomal protein L37-domain-containing protein, partial [Xylaria arbuscula]
MLIEVCDPLPLEPHPIGESALQAPTTPIQNFWSFNWPGLEPFQSLKRQSPQLLFGQSVRENLIILYESTDLEHFRVIMICRRCLQRASALSTRIARTTSTTTPLSWNLSIRARPISSTPTRQNAAAAAAAASTTATTETPPLSTPLADSEGGASAGESLSSCPEGTVMTGLNYFKNKTDPLALADSAYPEWLWKCLDVQKKADEGEADDAGDEFSKSKKQRRIAAKRQRVLEAKLLAEGNLEALAPKIPLQHQSINLPANEAGTTEGALQAVDAREELRRAMRRERKAKIKEGNYLKSM